MFDAYHRIARTGSLVLPFLRYTWAEIRERKGTVSYNTHTHTHHINSCVDSRTHTCTHGWTHPLICIYAR